VFPRSQRRSHRVTRDRGHRATGRTGGGSKPYKLLSSTDRTNRTAISDPYGDSRLAMVWFRRRFWGWRDWFGRWTAVRDVCVLRTLQVRCMCKAPMAAGYTRADDRQGSTNERVYGHTNEDRQHKEQRQKERPDYSILISSLLHPIPTSTLPHSASPTHPLYHVF
jgi:hypothetical protein